MNLWTEKPHTSIYTVLPPFCAASTSVQARVNSPRIIYCVPFRESFGSLLSERAPPRADRCVLGRSRAGPRRSSTADHRDHGEGSPAGFDAPVIPRSISNGVRDCGLKVGLATTRGQAQIFGKVAQRSCPDRDSPHTMNHDLVVRRHHPQAAFGRSGAGKSMACWSLPGAAGHFAFAPGCSLSRELTCAASPCLPDRHSRATPL
jgi:hypothetical protein